MAVIILGLFFTRSASDFPWTLSETFFLIRQRIN